ncbi:putative entry exclusion protein TrbK-alt [Bradyrhizobium canariense]|uniref:Conjugative transfer region protein TrbK n=1 Tax=Bradyrhizobium canariense TaxID=255045 RepID=A0A1H1V8X0_9BRAD|nr:putative entry exclusion protein TrbK-alt [Bradyrhizobium canariense]SDS81165.1 conjugative transfer region protein TrbK [Bradyrhizobium canariense]
MNIKTLKRLPSVAAVMLVVLVVTACAIRLRGDEDQMNSSAPVDRAADPLATKLAECRSVTYEEKDALSECRNAWAEKHRQFLGQKPSASSEKGNPQEGSSLFVPPKDEGRLSPGYPPIQQPGKE